MACRQCSLCVGCESAKINLYFFYNKLKTITCFPSIADRISLNVAWNSPMKSCFPFESQSHTVHWMLREQHNRIKLNIKKAHHLLLFNALWLPTYGPQRTLITTNVWNPNTQHKELEQTYHHCPPCIHALNIKWHYK